MKLRVLTAIFANKARTAFVRIARHWEGGSFDNDFSESMDGDFRYRHGDILVPKNDAPYHMQCEITQHWTFLNGPDRYVFRFPARKDYITRERFVQDKLSFEENWKPREPV